MKPIDSKPNNESKNGIANAVLSRIDAEQIEPTPRWQFVFSECTIWSLWLISVIVGAASIAVMLYVSVNASYAFYEATHDSFLEFVVEVAPFLWLLTFLLMAAVAHFNLRHTKKGYRYPVWQMLMSSIFVSILGGSVLHAAGAGQVIDTLLDKTMPLYPSYEEHERRWWTRPNEGLLVGRVTGDNFEITTLRFTDSNDGVWQLEVGELPPPDRTLLESGKLVKVIGVRATSSLDQFFGCGVFPWMHDKPIKIADIKKEKEAFILKIQEYKQKVKDRYEMMLEREALRDTSAEKLDPMGVCPGMPIVKKMP